MLKHMHLLSETTLGDKIGTYEEQYVKAMEKVIYDAENTMRHFADEGRFFKRVHSH